MSWELNHVIAGTDFQESSTQVCAEAVRLGAVYGAKVTLVHIATASGDLSARMDAFVEGLQVPAGVELEAAIRSGAKVANELANFAEEIDADLLCVGPRAHGFMEKHVVGGVAEQLLSRTTIPTLATAGPATGGYHKILVAVDNSPAAGRALRVASRLLRGIDGEREIICLHALSGRAVDALSKSPELDDVKQAMLENQRTAVEEFAKRYVSDDIELTFDVQVGAFGHILPMRVSELTPDLVCMGTAGRKGLMGVLAGNSAERMIRKLGIPILIAHP